MADDSRASDVGARYARALFDLCLETGVLDAVEVDLKSLKAMLAESGDLRVLLASPRFSSEEKAKGLAAIAKRASLSDTTSRFLGVLAGNRRASALGPIVAAFEQLMKQDELTPDWLSLRHRLTFALRKLRGGSDRLSDIRVAIFGPAALTALARRFDELRYALPKKSFYAVHAEPKLFFEPWDFSALINDPEITGLHISPKGRGNTQPIAGSLYAWAAERFGSL